MKISDKDYKIDLNQTNTIKIGKKSFFKLNWIK